MTGYVIGVDFGTLSARAVVVETETGREAASCALDYAHGVLESALPDGTPLGADWALQVPGDYVDAFRAAVRGALAASGVGKEEVRGIGIDITSNTMLPIDREGRPLCETPRFASCPWAYVMPWKHHAGQRCAETILRIARERNEPFLRRYGGGVSAEWMLPKLMQIVEEAPEVYDAADRFMEVGDWLVMRMTGREIRSEAMAGYKAFWSREAGYPSEDFLTALHPRLRNLVRDKLGEHLYPIGTCAGGLTEESAEDLGLCPGTPVAVANIDAHVSLPGAGICDPGHLLMILGTSTCLIMNAKEQKDIPGICGVVRDGVSPGYWGYEAGQSCCGDHFRWLFQNAVPESCAEEARARGIGLHELLSEKAALLQPGESGLLALDWWNGNRSVLMDMNLSGMILGLTMQTRPEEIYRALIEATAFGMRRIVDAFEENGLPVHSLLACGGIARKNPLFMQIYADVSGREIRISRSAQTPALGSAMFGAVAAGSGRGGYDSIAEAASRMGGIDPDPVRPDLSAHETYNALYTEYLKLHDLFGRGGNPVMKRLREMRSRVINGRNALKAAPGS